jgi:WD40 repeat protein
MAPNTRAKTTYRVFSKLEKFYTGGSIRLTKDETSVVCVCADEVKVRLSTAHTDPTPLSDIYPSQTFQKLINPFQVVEITSGVTRHTFPGDTEPVTALAVSPNGMHIFSSSRSLTSKAWDLTTGTCFRTWRVRSRPDCPASCPVVSNSL